MSEKRARSDRDKSNAAVPVSHPLGATAGLEEGPEVDHAYLETLERVLSVSLDEQYKFFKRGAALLKEKCRQEWHAKRNRDKSAA